jgi:hypothetical protein
VISVHREHRGVEQHGAEELAEDDLDVGDRRGQQQLDRARAAFPRSRCAS